MNLNTVLWPRKKIIYLAIGKTASTSIKRAIAEDMGRPVPEGESPHFSPYLDYVDDAAYIIRLLNDGWLSLVVERDPVDRFTSWYLDKINRNDGPSKYATDYGFEAGPMERCVNHLVLDIPLIIKEEMETHLAPQRYLQKMILSDRTPNIRLPFSNVWSTFHSLFGVDIGWHNKTEGPGMKVSSYTRLALNEYYHGDRECLR